MMYKGRRGVMSLLEGKEKEGGMKGERGRERKREREEEEE
jgi:hypothetical protein